MNATTNVRVAAVAGLFYPAQKDRLQEQVDGLLSGAETPRLENVRALIVPHAGYTYSGPVAAVAYNAVRKKPYKTVVVIGPSHYARFSGISVFTGEAYETPLGRVPISAMAKTLASRPPFLPEPRCQVYRPGWFASASRPVPPPGHDTPETWEHSVEVQVPFLQRVLPGAELVSLVYGEADPAKAARVLAEVLDEHTLLVASSDLSHFLPYERATETDRKTLQLITALNVDALAGPEAEDTACGRMPILVVMHLARLKGWQPHLLLYKNSGDTSGDRSRVVGYAAVAFCAPGGTNTEAAGSGTNVAQSAPGSDSASGRTHQTVPETFSPEQQRFLLGLARRTIRELANGRPVPEPDPEAIDPGLRKPKGCFVTLTKAGQLRGCIGNILPDKPLYRAVIENAKSAAFHDYRFPPVTADEVPELKIEISVLSVPEPLTFGSPAELLEKLQPHKHGVILRIGGRSATFLPQVWAQLPEKTKFLEHLSMKAGCPPDAWRGKDVAVEVYTVTAFEEH